jgi:hypothetical protein
MLKVNDNEIKVQNMESSKGNNIPNQFIINTKDGIYLQSYNSIIVFESKDGKTYLDNYYWNYSKTTGKYRNLFLNETKKDTENKIKDGTYILTNLN